MRENEIIKVAIAETSVIIRTGTALVLKKIQGLKLMPIEIVSPDNLIECLRFHKPDVLVMNPAFPGHFDVRGLKRDMQIPDMKCVALVCSVTDQNILQDYDESVSLYDAPDVLSDKLNRLLNTEEDTGGESVGLEILSGREKEIVACVARGMTNKEIAEALFLSAHTVITHRRNIARKLQIHSPAGLTIYAIVNKLVELQDIKGYL
ncbi:response regulator transcription factor [Odoribacter sp. Z80]|uniref:response regulator transcription factor n=1 Tax=Odoribacter sp. Z80 TaxID=2304575 RepID=UPI00137B4181|nr:response regulator transcription factor [Odoribacter sp. Z80]NCE72686.1 DNA-binding response regulator [Odoribacter sp. Z80]